MDAVHAKGDDRSPTAMAVMATLHCLTGCAIGEILGMVISAAVNASNVLSIAVSVILAFIFGYGLTLTGIVRHGMPFREAVKLALASDTASISSMEIVDNTFVALVPGALSAGLGDALFWWSLLVSLVISFFVTVPVNRFLIVRGKGHALMHEHHQH